MTRTILVVDDDAPIRFMLTRLLTSEGYEVVAAGAAADAEAALEGSTFDLVISDVVMPGGSGIELRVAIAARQPGVPVILISGFSADGPARFAAEAERTAFLQKPFAASRMLELVAEMLGEGPPA